ncbi:MAG: hypothetical protein M1461_02115, partial [Nitrospirae bacterium]|nr:hypothetical protein [Nitrospirota bacterium]
SGVCYAAKTNGKPCAGNPHARFERGTWERSGLTATAPDSTNETEFTGPGFIYAYKLEDEFAKTSRVLVGPLLATNIVKFAKINPNTESPMNAFSVGKDDKIIVDPHFVIGPEMVNILESLQQNAGQSKNKYDEVIEILKTPKEKVRRPTIEEMSSYIKDITAELNEGEP